MVYSMFTGEGFDMGFLGSFSMAWLGLVILIFLILFARKWLAEEGGLPFNWIFACIGTGFAYLVTITIVGSFKWAFLIGFIGLIIGGFGIGYFIDAEGGGGY
jgi:hypothetical protein